MQKKNFQDKDNLNVDNTSEEKYRLLFNSLPYGGEVLDKKGNIINCSPSTARMLGYEISDLIGKHITEFLTEESISVFKEKYSQPLVSAAVLRGSIKSTEDAQPVLDKEEMIQLHLILISRKEKVQKESLLKVKRNSGRC